jgi:hypothetical protein
MALKLGNPEMVEYQVFMKLMQPFQGCELAVSATQGSSFLATLG